MADYAVPLQTQAAFLLRGGLKNRAGSLLLYPDQLVHVGSKLAQFGVGFGLIGMVLTRGIANSRAPGKVAKGGTSVTAIPFTNITRIVGQTHKVGKPTLVVRTLGGDEFRFGVPFDKWSDDLGKALTAAGRTVTPTEEGLSVS